MDGRRRATMCGHLQVPSSDGDDVTDERRFPAGDRPGRSAWLGPGSLFLGLLSWLFPIGGAPLALAAIVLATVSMTTLTRFRIDWTAVVGLCLGVGQALLSLALFSMSLSGR